MFYFIGPRKEELRFFCKPVSADQSVKLVISSPTTDLNRLFFATTVHMQY